MLFILVEREVIKIFDNKERFETYKKQATDFIEIVDFEINPRHTELLPEWDI